MKKRKYLSDSSVSKAVFIEELKKEWEGRHYHNASDIALRLANTGRLLSLEEKLLVSVALMADTIPQSEAGIIAQTLWDESFLPLITGTGSIETVSKYAIELAHAFIHNGDAMRASATLELIDLYVPDHLTGEYQRAKGAYIDRFGPPRDNVTSLFPK